MPGEGSVDEARRDEARARVESVRKLVEETGANLSLVQVVGIVLGEGEWEAIVEWVEFALIDKPLMTSEDLVDGIVFLYEWSMSNA